MILLKFLLFIFIFFFIIKKVGGFVLRVLFGAAAQQAQQQHRAQTRKPTDGNVHIDNAPKKGEKSTKDFKGGDYVDFEEVKE